MPVDQPKRFVHLFSSRLMLTHCGSAARQRHARRVERNCALRARLRLAVRRFSLFCIFAFIAGCNSDDAKPEAVERQQEADVTAAESTLLFVDRANDCGIEFVPNNGQDKQHFSILESLGSGAACIDYDVDGYPDAFVLGGGTYDASPAPIGLPAALFRNDADWKFSVVTGKAHVGKIGFYSHGAIVGDVDSDGFQDVLVTGYGELVLLRNNGDGTFTESSLTGSEKDRWSTGAAFGDFNGDGHLDVFAVSYVTWSFANHPNCDNGPKREVCTPGVFESQRDQLLLSDGQGGFVNASDRFGLKSDGKGLAAISADVDSDGDLDVYVANDTTPNFLYRNDGDRFKEIGLESATSLNAAAEADGSMGIDVADFDQDGLCDICVANYEKQFFALYRQSTELGFDHVSSHVGITRVGQVFVGFGTVFVDADCDGDEDILVTNGHVMRNPANSPVMQHPILFENTDGRFANRANDAGDYLNSPHMGRGIGLADFDRDGDPDAIVTHMNQPVAVLENRSTDAPNWLAVRLVCAESERTGLGARVEVQTSEGTQTRWTKSGGSYLSSSENVLLFGLGNTERIKRVVVHWPTGKASEFADVQPGQTVLIQDNIDSVTSLSSK